MHIHTVTEMSAAAQSQSPASIATNRVSFAILCSGNQSISGTLDTTCQMPSCYPERWQLSRQGETALYDAIVEGAGTRLSPVLMTAMLATIGLIPAALSTGIGSDVQKPLALAIIGGMITGVIGTLFALPVLYMLIAGRYPSNGKRADSGGLDTEPVYSH